MADLTASAFVDRLRASPRRAGPAPSETGEERPIEHLDRPERVHYLSQAEARNS